MWRRNSFLPTNHAGGSAASVQLLARIRRQRSLISRRPDGQLVLAHENREGELLLSG
jgi:hypothetical protein